MASFDEEGIARLERWRQVSMAGLLGTLLLGLFWAPAGKWTGPALVAWFLGTQRLWMGWGMFLGLQVLNPGIWAAPMGVHLGRVGGAN